MAKPNQYVKMQDASNLGFDCAYVTIDNTKNPWFSFDFVFSFGLNAE